MRICDTDRVSVRCSGFSYGKKYPYIVVGHVWRGGIVLGEKAWQSLEIEGHYDGVGSGG